MVQEVTAMCYVPSSQMNDIKDKNRAIKHFVRASLGCACPDQIFEHIRITEHADMFASASTLYEIGGRLFVTVIDPVDWHDITASLDQLVDTGKQYRDQQGYNRFRLVIVTDDDEAVKNLQSTFDGLPNIDEKTHLHVLKPQQLPWNIRPGC